MGFNACNIVSKFMMKVTSSSFECINLTFGSTFGVDTTNIAIHIFDFISQLFYFVLKWLLYIVDIIFFYIRQLSGLEMDLSSLNNAISKDSDMVFNLLISNRRMVTSIIRNLIGIALILIVVFTIVAIIKNQLTSLGSGNTKNYSLEALGKSLRAIMLIIITPMIAIVSIVASNVLLKALYNATNTTNSNSLSSSVFMVASTSANKYRSYALDNKRIPITFDFSSQEEIMKGFDESEELTDKMREYLTSSKNVIYTTAQLFGNKTFSKFKDTANSENYYLLYDHQTDKKISDDDPLKEYKRIRAYQEEYFVMADMIDYAVKSCNTLYIKTVERMLDSILELPKDEGERIFNDVVSTYGINFYSAEKKNDPISDREPTKTLYEIYNGEYDIENSGEIDIIRFSSMFYSVNEEGEPETYKEIQYNHVTNTIDEAKGAVFIMTSEQTVNVAGVNYTYYYPVTVGSKDYGTSVFTSDYIRRGYIVPAKGIFSEAGYPTAIKESKDGKNLIFYRDNLETLTIGDSEKIFNQEYKEKEEEEEADSGFVGVIKAIGKFFKKLFTPSSWVPDVTFTPEAVTNTYTKVTSEVNKLEDGGKLHISYLYSDNITLSITGHAYGLRLYNLYNPLNINFLILTIGTAITFKICLTGVFALIKRSYDLFLLILMYPAACATVPVDNAGSGKNKGNSSYSKWITKFYGAIFKTYGLILAINFVLMLFPIIESIEFFKPSDISSNLAIRRIGVLFFKVMSVNQITKLTNIFVAILCELVAFSLIKELPDIIAGIVGGDSISSDNTGADMLKTLQDAGRAVVKATTTVLGFGKIFGVLTKKGRESLKADLKTKAKQMKEYLPINRLPLSDLYGATKTRLDMINKKKEQEKAYKDLKEALKGAEGQDKNNKNPKATEEVKEKLKKFQEAQNAYTDATENPVGHSKASSDKKSGGGKSSKVKSREDDETLDSQEGGDSEKGKKKEKTARDYRREKRRAKRRMKRYQRKMGGGGMTGDKNYDKYEEEKEKYYRAKRNETYKKTEDKGLDKYEKKLQEIQRKKGDAAAAAYAKRHPIKTARYLDREYERGQADSEYTNNTNGSKTKSTRSMGGDSSNQNSDSQSEQNSSSGGTTEKTNQSGGDQGGGEQGGGDAGGAV